MIKTKIKINCVCSIVEDISIDCGLCLYKQYDVALWLVHEQIFAKQIKSQNLIGLYLF
jgi:hypothetical protein